MSKTLKIDKILEKFYRIAASTESHSTNGTFAYNGQSGTKQSLYDLLLEELPLDTMEQRKKLAQLFGVEL